MSVERLAELLDSAREAPWSLRGRYVAIRGDTDAETAWFDIGEFYDSEDAAVVVALRNAAPELLAVVEAARELIAPMEPFNAVAMGMRELKLREAVAALQAKEEE